MASILSPKGKSGNSSSGSGGGDETVNPPTKKRGGTPVPVRDSETGEPLNEAARNLESANNTPTANASGQSAVDSSGNTPPSQGGDQPSPEDAGSSLTISEQIEKARQQALQIQEDLKKQASQVRQEEGSEDPGSGVTSSSRQSRQQDQEARRQVETLTAPDSGVESARKAYENVLNTLDQQMAQVGEREQMRINEIKQSQNQNIRETEQEQNREKAQTRSDLVRSGGFLGGSASSQAVLKRMSDTHRQEIASLEAQKASAISEAQRAFMQERSKLAREMAQQAVNMEETINQRRQQFFDNVLQISQEKRQQEQSELNIETQKLNNAQTRAELMAPNIASSLSGAENESEKQEILSGYAEKYSIDQNVLASKVQEYQSEQTATQLQNQTSRARLRKINQQLSQNEVISKNTYQKPNGQYVTDLKMRTPEGNIVNQSVRGGVGQVNEQGDSGSALTVTDEESGQSYNITTVEGYKKAAQIKDSSELDIMLDNAGVDDKNIQRLKRQAGVQTDSDKQNVQGMKSLMKTSLRNNSSSLPKGAEVKPDNTEELEATKEFLRGIATSEFSGDDRQTAMDVIDNLSLEDLNDGGWF